MTENIHEFVQELDRPKEKGFLYFFKGQSVYRVKAGRPRKVV